MKPDPPRTPETKQKLIWTNKVLTTHGSKLNKKYILCDLYFF